MKISIGCDISAYSQICDNLVFFLEKEKQCKVVKCGAMAGNDKADYIDAAIEVAEMVASKEVDYGILLCNTGTGVSIIANKVYGVRAAVCVDSFAAKISKLANNANVLALSVRYCGEKLLMEIIDTWIETQPSTEERRITFHKKTEDVDKKYRTNFN
jgi:RpiB/LacA/LacB family sugar-phosphate isomerase